MTGTPSQLLTGAHQFVARIPSQSVIGTLSPVNAGHPHPVMTNTLFSDSDRHPPSMVTTSALSQPMTGTHLSNHDRHPLLW